MARYLLLALNGPTPDGDEAAYNRWYDEVHVPDLEAIDGVLSARRFKVLQAKGVDHPYVAAYEIETDDLEALMADMTTKPRPFDPNFDRPASGFVLAQAIGPAKKD
jgi:hypothetical protein